MTWNVFKAYPLWLHNPLLKMCAKSRIHRPGTKLGVSPCDLSYGIRNLRNEIFNFAIGLTISVGCLTLLLRMHCWQPQQNPEYLSTRVKRQVPRLFKNRPPETQNNGSVGTSNPTNAFPAVTVEGNDVSASTATTTFLTDADIVTAAINHQTRLDSKNYTTSSDNYKQDIIDFMAKPVIVLSGDLQAGDTVSTFASTFQPRAALASNSMYTNKLAGYLGFRAKQIIRIVVNANPFQQGRYMLYVVHIGGSATTNSLAAANAVSNTLVQRSVLPHVEIDIACDSEALIEVPYLSQYNYYPLAALTAGADTGCVFKLGLAPYVPLSSGTGSTKAGFTIWSHFEDVELIGPAVPQSGRLASKAVSKSESEKERAAVMPILSSTLIRISKAATAFHDVPLLSDYTNTVSWASDILAKAASAFGWSKPNQIAPATRVTRMNMPYATTVDGIDQSQPVSLLQKAAVGPAQGFSGTDIDELDISYLVSIPGYRSTTSWLSSSLSGALLINAFVSPVANPATRLANTLTYADYTPLQFCCRFFETWRGSLVYKFKLVKTQYHSGRLLVAFTPYSTILGSSPTASMIQTDYVHREIIDIRDCNEFSFVIPYMSTTPYSSTDTTFNTCTTGRLLVYVLDPIVAPDTVNGTVSIILEQCAGPDFELAVPAFPQLTPGYNLTPQMGGSFEGKQNVCAIGDPFIGATSGPRGDDGINSINCIGEKIGSFRQLLKVSNPVVTQLAALSPVQQYFGVLPYATASVWNAVTPTFSSHSADIYSILSSCYTFARGGMRAKFVMACTTALENVSQVNLITFPVGFSTTMAQYQTTDILGSTGKAAGLPTAFEIRSNPVVEVQVPQYHRYRVRVTADHLTNSTNLLYSINDAGTVNPTFLRLKMNSATDVSSIVYYRSMSDDGNFGAFRAIPPMLTSATSAGNFS